jgi:3-oxo-5alpha-steroid 4-dehydrogenase
VSDRIGCLSVRTIDDEGGNMTDEKEVSVKLSRRDFVKGTAVGAALLSGAGVLAGCGTAAPVPAAGMPEQWDDEADVVIVGLGGAGAAAAIEASRAGASVLVLERTPTGGGSTAICGGIIYMGGGTPLQTALGFDDSRENMYNYVFASAGDGADEELVGLFCDKSLELYDWVTELGVQFNESFMDMKAAGVPTGDGLLYSGNEKQANYKAVAEPAPRGHGAFADGRVGGHAIFGPLQAAVADAGAEVLYEALASSLVVNAEGRVVGVEAEVEGEKKYYKASKGVILCAGGYAANKEMVAKHCPSCLRCAVNVGTPGDDGSGIRMGQGVGADVRMLSETTPFAFVYGAAECLCGSILVNGKGQRFIGEDNYGEWIGDAIVRDHHVAFLVLDDAVWSGVPDAAKESLTVVAQAETVSELAMGIGIPPALLENTVELYNQFAANGEDPEFGKDSAFVIPLETPPYYALFFGVEATAFFTNGGLSINSQSQVLDVHGQPVPGLYAAGRNAFAVPARHYVASGVSVAEVLIFGRIAGQTVAAEEPAE